MVKRRDVFKRGGAVLATAAFAAGGGGDDEIDIKRQPRRKPGADGAGVAVLDAKDLNKVDVVFVLDATGSMGAYIDEAKQRAKAEAEKIAQQGELDIQFGLVAYRDHPPQDETFVTQVTNLGKADVFQAALNSLGAAGGGDGPEAVWDGLVMAALMNWRPNSDRHIFLIGDAPPHGMAGSWHDGFPTGCPCGATQESVIALLKSVQAKVFAHSIAGLQVTTQVFTAVAQETGGTCTVSNTPSEMTHAYAGTMTTTSGSIGAASSFTSTYNEYAASMPDATPAMLLHSTNASLGWTPEEWTSNAKYLRTRGIGPVELTDFTPDVTKIDLPVTKPKRTRTPRKS